MRIFFLIICSLIFCSCQKEDATPEFQSELFSYIKTKWTSEAPKCDPSFSTLRNEELTVYCLPLSDKEISANSGEYTMEEARPEVREWTKGETTTLVMKWTTESNRNVKSILTRFTDEIVAESKK